MNVKRIEVKPEEIREGDAVYDASNAFMGLIKRIDDDGCLELVRYVQPDMVKSADRYVIGDEASGAEV